MFTRCCAFEAVPFYGVYDLLNEGGDALPMLDRFVWPLVFKARPREDPERFRAASPMHRVHPGAPPMFVVHGQRDSLIPAAEARRFVQRLRAESREPVLYAEMKGGQHAFDIVPSWRTVPVVEAIERFFATIYRKRSEGAASEERELGMALGD